MSDIGFAAATWTNAPTFGGRCAIPADVEAGLAVFALADTVNGRPLELRKPTPVVWHAEDEQFAALVVQAESHETNDDGPAEFYGLLLPGGGTAVVFADDLEFVDADDPVWLSLLEADSAPGEEADWD